MEGHMDEDTISRHVLDSAMKIHTALGCGLLENIYETCLANELNRRGLEVRNQVVIPVHYEGAILDVGYRLDLLVGDKVIVEVKAVEKVLALHRAQLLSYLKLGGFKPGLLLNFNTVHLREGIKRVVN
jgi:GxxExxY protein